MRLLLCCLVLSCLPGFFFWLCSFFFLTPYLLFFFVLYMHLLIVTMTSLVSSSLACWEFGVYIVNGQVVRKRSLLTSTLIPGFRVDNLNDAVHSYIDNLTGSYIIDALARCVHVYVDNSPTNNKKPINRSKSSIISTRLINSQSRTSIVVTNLV